MRLVEELKRFREAHETQIRRAKERGWTMRPVPQGFALHRPDGKAIADLPWRSPWPSNNFIFEANDEAEAWKKACAVMDGNFNYLGHLIDIDGLTEDEIDRLERRFPQKAKQKGFRMLRDSFGDFFLIHPEDDRILRCHSQTEEQAWRVASDFWGFRDWLYYVEE
jgi:hypothetical protein